MRNGKEATEKVDTSIFPCVNVLSFFFFQEMLHLRV